MDNAMTSTTMRLNRLKALLDKKNKKKKYFLPLMEKFLFLKRHTRNFLLEEGGEEEGRDVYLTIIQLFAFNKSIISVYFNFKIFLVFIVVVLRLH